MRIAKRGRVAVAAVWLALMLCSTCAAEETGGDAIEIRPGEPIQAAIDAAPDGATIRIAPGEYAEVLSIPKSISLFGSADPLAPTVITAPSLYPVITVTGDADATLEDLVVVGTQRYEMDAIAVYGSADVVIRGVEVRESRGNGINIYSSGTIEIVDCTIHSNDLYAIVVQTDSATVLGRDNDLRGNGAELGLYAPPELRTPLAVQTESVRVRVPDDYVTVQEAIDAVAPSGTVEIAEGSFSEALTVWKTVTIVGRGEATEVTAPKDALHGGVVLHCVEALTLEAVQLGRSWTVCSETASLLNVTVLCRDGVGIELNCSATATLDAVRVRQVRGPGLRLNKATRALLEDCTFTNCYEGVNVDERGSAEASQCTFESCGISGIAIDSREGSAAVRDSGFIDNGDGVSSVGSVMVERCAFDRTRSRAVRVNGGETDLRSCAVRASGEAGLSVFGGTIRARDCVIAETTGKYAVFCEQTGQVELVDCTIAENLGYGVYVQENGGARLTGCTITDNGLSRDEWSDSAGVLICDDATVRLDGCSVGRNAGPGIEVFYLSPEWRLDPSVPENTEPECELFFADCRVFNNAEDGLYVMGGRTVEIERTKFERNYGNGIWIDEPFGGTVRMADSQIAEQIESGIILLGGAGVSLERCTITENAELGVLVARSVDASIRGCRIAGNVIGVALVQSPRVDLTDCEITGNLGYGLQVYCLECSGGRHLHEPSMDFTGELTGAGNVIPDASGLSGNGMAGICPAGWEFLLKGGGEASGV